jgi:hypothetical protein
MKILSLTKKLAQLLLATCLSLSLLAPGAALARPAQEPGGQSTPSPTTRVEPPSPRARAMPIAQPGGPVRGWEPSFWRLFHWFRR